MNEWREKKLFTLYYGQLSARSVHAICPCVNPFACTKQREQNTEKNIVQLTEKWRTTIEENVSVFVCWSIHIFFHVCFDVVEGRLWPYFCLLFRFSNTNHYIALFVCMHRCCLLSIPVKEHTHTKKTHSSIWNSQLKTFILEHIFKLIQLIFANS